MSEKKRNAVGERLKMIRKNQRMNQSEFAKEIGVSSTAICRMESGKHDLSRQIRRLLYEKFHVNPEWLDSGEGTMYAVIDVKEGEETIILNALRNDPVLLGTVKGAIQRFTLEDWLRLMARAME